MTDLFLDVGVREKGGGAAVQSRKDAKRAERAPGTIAARPPKRVACTHNIHLPDNAFASGGGRAQAFEKRVSFSHSSSDDLLSARSHFSPLLSRLFFVASFLLPLLSLLFLSPLSLYLILVASPLHLFHHLHLVASYLSPSCSPPPLLKRSHRLSLFSEPVRQCLAEYFFGDKKAG